MWILFAIDKSLFELFKDVIYVCVFASPEGSRYYTTVDGEGDSVSMLENCLVDNALLDNDYYLIISGDLNARTFNVSKRFLYQMTILILYIEVVMLSIENFKF